MARPGVTESEVFEAIQSLVEMGAKVTVESVRAELGHGSPNTINRHLRTWREKPQPIRESSLQVKQLKKEQLALKTQIETSVKQTEHLSLEILERDQKILGLEQEVREGQEAFKTLNQELEQLRLLHKTLLAEKEKLIDTLLQNQKAQVEQFREDLKAINQMSLSQVREISLNDQEAWLAEKVKVRELQKELAALKIAQETLRKELLAEQSKNEPLKKRLAEKEQIIAQCLDPKKFEALTHLKEVL